MKLLPKALLTTLFSLAAAGCGDATSEDPTDTLLADDTGTAQQQLTSQEEYGQDLFKTATFSGNGRTCSTCHTNGTGTITPAQVQSAWNYNRYGSQLFERIDSDDGSGSSYSKLRTHATFNVEINLPSNIRLAGSSARKVTLRRAVPTTIDSPKLDTMRMFDGRVTTLQDQAAGAIVGHAEGRQPYSWEKDAIAAYEKTLFSSTAMRNYANGTGPMPGIPAGTTPEEIRGRAWFEPTALCGSCHNGALLNVMTAGNPMGLPAGTQFGTALVSERNKLNNPVKEYIVTNPDSTETHVITPDPGLMLVTGDAGTANLFKMMSLRNLKNTPPYFSDGSAKTVEDIVDQYDFLMNTLGIPHTSQDLVDITAYLKLL